MEGGEQRLRATATSGGRDDARARSSVRRRHEARRHQRAVRWPSV